MAKKKEIKKQPVKAKPKPANNIITRFAWLIIIAVVFIAYGQTLKFGYAMDDGMMIQNNKAVQMGFSGIPLLVSKGSLYYFEPHASGSYRPITMSSFAITTGLFHTNAFADHFYNLILYCLCCILLFLTLQRMLPGWHPALHLLTTLLFLLHPVHTEVVANIKSRDELMCFTGCFGALYFLFRYVQNIRIINVIIACLFYIFALGSKENAVPFLLLFPITLFFFTKIKPVKILQYSIPFAVLVVLFLIIRAGIIQGGDSSSQVSMIDNSLVGAKTLQDKYATILFIILKYLGLLVFPYHLVFDYSYNQVPTIGFSDPKAILSFIVLAALAIIAVMGLRRKSIYSYSILFFFINMLAVLNIIMMISATMAERFLFLPSVAFCLVVVSLLVKLFKVDVRSFSFASQKAITGIVAVVLVLYSVKTYSRSKDWANNRLLFEAAVIDSPNSTRTHGSLGYELTEAAISANDPKEKNELFSRAAEQFKSALAIYEPNEKAWYNYGHALYEMGNLDEAYKAFSRAIELDNGDIKALNNLGAISLQHSQFEKAMQFFKRGVAIDPNSADLYANIGACNQYMGNFEAAKENYEKALSLDPNHVNARNNLNRLLPLMVKAPPRSSP